MRVFVVFLRMLHISLVSLIRTLYNLWMSCLQKGTA